MGKLLKLLNGFKKLNVDKVSEQSLNDIKDDISEAQRQQLLHGVSSSGGTLRKYKSSAYAKKKHGMNPLPGVGNPDLKLTGAFHRSITTTVNSGKMIIKASDDKALMLEASYGKDVIFGLYREEKAAIIHQKLKKAFIKNIRKNLKS
jgi:hypothetical protein